MRYDKGDWKPQGQYLSCVDYDESTFIQIAPIGMLRHDPTHQSFMVYKPISRFKRLMLRWAFGLKYEKI